MTGIADAAAPSANAERLAQLYDPAYVRRVETLNGGMPVQVCLETRMLQDGAGTGVATYARVLSRCLGPAGAVPILLDDGQGERRGRARRWLAAARRSEREASVAMPGEDDNPAQWALADVFRESQVFFNIHRELLPVTFSRPPEVMHWTYPVPIYLVGAKNLYTVHDLIPLTDPALTPIPEARHRRILQAIAARAHGFVTVSETVRAQLVEHLALPPDRVFNTYQAVETPLQVDPPLPPMLRSGRYFLFCGRVEARKNLERLARAHAASGTGLPLVIVGPEVAGSEALERVLAAHETVIRLPWLPRAELLGLMRRARALLFPSLAEGFGLPIVEAMTLGCPVLTSDRGAPAEVAGDAALLVEPEDEAAIGEAIRRLSSDDRLCVRLRSAGFARGRFFSADAYSRRLRALYDRTLSDVGAGQ